MNWVRGIVTVLPFIALLVFPWELSAVLALAAAFYSPYIPLAVGLFADALYYTRGVAHFPLFTFVGLITSLAALFLHRFVETSVMHV